MTEQTIAVHDVQAGVAALLAGGEPLTAAETAQLANLLTLEERLEYEESVEDHGKCEACDSRGALFRLPTGQLFCIHCTASYISWEQDDGRRQAPELFAWLWSNQ